MRSPGPRVVQAPANGLWRVGRGADPLASRSSEPGTLTATRSGNRFDSTDANFAVLYFATTLEGCFGETLARFRPSLDMVALVKDDWQARSFMDVGSVPRGWRQRRTSVRALVEPDRQFLDVESRHTHQYLREKLALGLSSLGYQDLDVATVRGSDRRVTRLIASWAFRATGPNGFPYAGIRYLSRLDTAWELWAVFDDVPIEPLETRPILPDTHELRTVAAEFGLTVH